MTLINPAPSTRYAGTSPKYDDSTAVCAFIFFRVGFGGGRVGVAQVNALEAAFLTKQEKAEIRKSRSEQ